MLYYFTTKSHGVTLSAIHFSVKFCVLSGALKDLNICNTDDIGKDTCGGYARTGTIALNHHRIFLIAFGSEKNNIVASFQAIERMASTHFLQRNASLSVFQLGHKLPMLVFGFQLLTTGFEIGIQ